MNKKLIYGIGINDSNYKTRIRKTIGYINGKQKQAVVWQCPIYTKWASMLERCYSSRIQDKYPTYKGCSVCKEWLTFSNFKDWMEKQDWEGNELDKDILFSGNKLYSPERCAFVPHIVNAFVIDCGRSRGEYLIGCHFNKIKNKFVSQCRNPFTKKVEHLGYFDNEQDAHQKWVGRKIEIAVELSKIQTDVRIAEALISKYVNIKGV